MEIIHENEYLYKMNNEIEPYLTTHRQEGYVPGAEDHLHQKDTGIVGKIHVLSGKKSQGCHCDQSRFYRRFAEI